MPTGISISQYLAWAELRFDNANLVLPAPRLALKIEANWCVAFTLTPGSDLPFVHHCRMGRFRRGDDEGKRVSARGAKTTQLSAPSPCPPQPWNSEVSVSCHHGQGGVQARLARQAQ